MKKAVSFFMAILILTALVLPVNAKNYIKSGAEVEDDYTLESDAVPEIDVPSAILIEAKTGTVLFEKNKDDARAPASVTKVMTLLLVAEAIAEGRIALTDTVTVSAHAASMGGSQVFLKEGERFTAEDLIKCTVISSANDAAVALAEHVAGSEGTFVDMMNKRAGELGLTSTKFENVTGLDDDVTEHTMSASDIAVISRELIKHDCVTAYSSVWQDSIRNGEFVLTNTNRLVRYYEGCTGLKTGSTDKAGFCVTASAKRNGTELIAVVMGAESGSARNEAARTLLDFGFSNYTLYAPETRDVGSIRVKGCSQSSVGLYVENFSYVIKKSDLSNVTARPELPEYVSAPMNAGDTVGKLTYYVGEEVIGSADIKICESLTRISFTSLFGRMFISGFCAKKS